MYAKADLSERVLRRRDVSPLIDIATSSSDEEMEVTLTSGLASANILGSSQLAVVL